MKRKCEDEQDVEVLDKENRILGEVIVVDSEDDFAVNDSNVFSFPRQTYLEQINVIIQTVIMDESHLFDTEELATLGIYQSLSGICFHH
jgi:hypothetical protein